MTQHLGAQKLDHINKCIICRERLNNLKDGFSGSQAIRLQKKNEVPK